MGGGVDGGGNPLAANVTCKLGLLRKGNVDRNQSLAQFSSSCICAIRKAHMCFTPFLASFSIIVFETDQMLMGLTVDGSYRSSSTPLSTSLSSR